MIRTMTMTVTVTMTMTNTKSIHILTTGGTLEKAYSEQTGSVRNVTSKVDRYLSRLRLPDHNVHVVPLLNKDSLEMTEKDRAFILANFWQVLRQKVPIVITHGTDTMVETGLFLQKGLPDLKVPVVLTGAMTPLGFEDADGLQNLTESLMAVQLLPPAVWIVMHDCVYPVDRVQKDRTLGRFVWKDENETTQ